MIIRLRSRLASSAGPCCRSHAPLHCLPQMQRLGGRSDAVNARYCFYRDGLERITVDAAGTVGTLRQQISSDLSMPRENVTLSKDQKLVSNCIRYKQHTTKLNIKPGLELQLQLLSKTPEQFKDLSNNKLRLKQAGVQHGDMVSGRSKALQADVPHRLTQSPYGYPSSNCKLMCITAAAVKNDFSSCRSTCNTLLSVQSNLLSRSQFLRDEGLGQR